jgi:hypothetical protein
VYIANLLTEGPGMDTFTAGEAVERVAGAIGRPVDVVILNVEAPNGAVLERYAREGKRPLAAGQIPPEVAVLEGAFWRGPFARHDRRHLRAAVWAMLANKMLLK